MGSALKGTFERRCPLLIVTQRQTTKRGYLQRFTGMERLRVCVFIYLLRIEQWRIGGTGIRYGGVISPGIGLVNR